MKRSVGFLAAGLAFSGVAQAADQDLSGEIIQLKNQVEQLQARDNSGDVAKSVADILRDAEQRTRLFDEGAAGAGYDDGFYIRSGNFELCPSVAMQIRNVTSYVGETEASRNGWENGFEIRRVELELEGTEVTKNLYYDLVLKNSSEGSPFLDEVFVVYSFDNSPFKIKAGQYKENIHHEETVSFKRQLAVERSLMNEVVMAGLYDRVQGVDLLIRDDKSPLRGEFALHDGQTSQNTPYYDTASDSAVLEHFGVSGRVEWKPMGTWKDYSNFSARDTKETLLAFGVGADCTQGIFSDGIDEFSGNRVLAAADVQCNLPSPKIGMFGSFTADYTAFDEESSFDNDHRLNMGALAQIGWAIDRQWEVFARYDVIILDSDYVIGENLFHEITAGVNYFLSDNGKAKLSLDVGYLPNGSPIRNTCIGIPAATDEETMYVRAQLMLTI